jgi:leader peptidase (prepilin peptidase)/N-methyltransferase
MTGQAGIYFATHFALATIAVAAAAIDVEHMILPNELTIGGAVIALATSPLRPLGLQASAIGAVLGLVIAWLPSVAYKKLRGKSGQGLGDAKLAILAGAWHGFVGAFFVLLAGAFQMALTAFAMKALGIAYPIPDSVKRDIEELRAKAAAGDAEAKQLLEDDPIANEDAGGGLLTTGLPLGPFLVLALLELVFAGGPIFSAFDRLLAPG